MPKRIGNARATTDKRLGVLLKLQILGLVVAQPQLVAIVVTSLAESYAELQRLKARASQAWPEEYNNKEVELGSAALFPHVFEATFAIRVEEVDILLTELRIPESMVAGHRKRVSGRSALLVLLARLRQGQSQHSLGLILHMNPKRISEICTTMVAWMFQKWGHKPTQLYQLKDRMPLYAAAIQRTSGINGLDIFGFLDCTVRGVRRPLYGQEAIYNGHKKTHGMKYQALGLPDGLLAAVDGPRSARRHDSRVLVESTLENEIRRIQAATGVDYIAYADAAYTNSDVIMAGFDRVQRALDEDKEWFTKSMNADRTSVEWLFGIVCNKFRWVDYKDGNKVGKTAVGCYYITAILLTNCLTCMRGGNQHYARFECPPPTLSEYLNM
jgi:hypothetical protein